ncbi:hypothetical protein [Pseudomonas aeruginosa]|uniref:hypothetical protein n=1 Tax=Pseudomonas aeruginosa TaxID=287 RepID=UPI00210DB807|nr:hypothetical protein [Pseudomonas aeruginosa]MCT9629206.1 hypothetical protein [Pseudomonas aeruginosa]MCW8036522.1 hypothetical protein [Pseudomonas aeruginosa]
MKSFRFVNIWLLSHRDRKARHVNFHPQKNLLRGRNHTGKTSLIRSLFETLGAKPQGKLEAWDENTACLLEFSVDGRHFFALHQNGRRALFNANREMIIATSNFGEWSKSFCDVTDFNLVFTDKKESEIRPADPACFFLPFYVNQDGSWQAEWNTFGGLKRFSSPWGSILEYFTGVCPPEYYRARAEKAQESKVLEEHRREYKLLERTIERFSRTLPLSGPKVSAENFADEIALLTQEVNELNQRQEVLRNAAVREQDLLSSLEQQIRLADDALAAYDHDAKYLRAGDSEPLICPTCNAEHTKSFLDLLNFAEDARVLRELAGRLRDDANQVRRRCGTALAELNTLNGNYQRISKLLDTRKGELKFQDVVGSMGAESAFAAFEAERKHLQEAIDKALGAVDALEEKMKSLRAAKRTRAILDDFRSNYMTGRVALQLPSVDASKMKLTGRPDLSGSGGPRSILAYYAALWRTCQGETGTYDVPVVIDSPNQQAQDDINLPAVLHFIAKELPKDMQLIVGLETSTDFPFDREIHLDVKYSMLREDQWGEAESIVEPLLKEMYATMKSDIEEQDDTVAR